MDHLVNILVRFFVFLSRFAPFLSGLGLVRYRGDQRDGKKDDDQKLHILLVGYNGARNTGSDVRVAEIAKQIQERLGRDHVALSVLTLDAASIRCYFEEDVQLLEVPSIFFVDVFKACCANHAAILCEGSTLKSKFANALTLYSCEAAGIMGKQHKPCIAYGSEAGDMDAFLERTVRKLCKDTYFIARDQNSLDRAHELGLKGQLGTDTAWGFDSSRYEQWAVSQLKQSGWNGKEPLFGIAPINPFWWPVKPSLTKWIKARLTGDHSLQFQLWYFFSWSKQRKKQFEAYLDALAAAVNTFAAKHSCHVVLFGMERLDMDACRQLKERLTMPVSTILSSEHDGYRIAAVLRQLSYLVTSRYHAEVLSMQAKVPCVAVSMDERLDNIMQEMGLDAQFLLHTDDADLSSAITAALDQVLSQSEQIKEKLGQELIRSQKTLDEMGDFLADWLLSRRMS